MLKRSHSISWFAMLCFGCATSVETDDSITPGVGVPMPAAMSPAPGSPLPTTVDTGTDDAGSTMTDQPITPGQPSMPGDDQGVDEGAGVGTDQSRPDAPAANFATAPANLYRLTRQQYLNSVLDLFGEPLTLPDDLEPDTPLHGFAAVGAGEITISPLAVEKYEVAAHQIAREVFSQEPRRSNWLGCDDVGAQSPCLRTSIAEVGRRIWRRPLTDEEVQVWLDVVTEVGELLRDPWMGVGHAIAGMLQSSDFLFRVEVGEPDPDDPETRRYTQYEMASRLSYFLWNSTPDDLLLDSAEAGTLIRDGGLEVQVNRLLDDPRSQTALRAFFGEYLQLERLDTLQKDREVFPLMTDTLGASMRFEIESVIARLVFEEDTDIRTLLTTRETMVDDQLAGLYQLPPVEGWTTEIFPDRSPRGGFFTMAGFLALNAHNTVTSPTYRGKYIQNKFFCFDIPPPPPGVAGDLGSDPDAGPMTTREKLARHREDPSCAGCHQFMDPLGLALENFDALGMWRTTENGLPIDASGTLDDVAFTGGKRLGELVAETTDFGDCLTKQLYRRGMAHLEGLHEADTISELQTQFGTQGYRVRTLLKIIAESEAFGIMEEAP